MTDKIPRENTDNDEITRDDAHQYYQKGQDKYPPVTSILDTLDEDTTGLEYWRDSNDGTGDNAHHPHIFWYSRQRGTIVHAEALNPLADRNLMGNEEQQAMRNVVTGPDDSDLSDDASTCMKDVVYSIMANHYYDYATTRVQYDANTELFEILEDDVDYFVNEFQDLCDKLGITQESIVAVEQYLVHEDFGYGGQADLIYEDPDGNYVLADLKTSSGLRQTHILQGAAYKRAIEDTDLLDIDEVHREEVIRINPDKHHTVVHSDSYPNHLNQEYGPVVNVDWYETDGFLTDDYGNYDYEDTGELWATFRNLTERWHRTNDI